MCVRACLCVHVVIQYSSSLKKPLAYTCLRRSPMIFPLNFEHTSQIYTSIYRNAAFNGGRLLIEEIRYSWMSVIQTSVNRTWSASDAL